jgi:hypothetical protein
MKDEEHTHYDAHFQKEQDSLKVNMVHITTLHEESLKHLFSGGLSNRPVTFATI